MAGTLVGPKTAFLLTAVPVRQANWIVSLLEIRICSFFFFLLFGASCFHISLQRLSSGVHTWIVASSATLFDSLSPADGHSDTSFLNPQVSSPSSNPDIQFLPLNSVLGSFFVAFTDKHASISSSSPTRQSSGATSSTLPSLPSSRPCLCTPSTLYGAMQCLHSLLTGDLLP